MLNKRLILLNNDGKQPKLQVYKLERLPVPNTPESFTRVGFLAQIFDKDENVQRSQTQFYLWKW
jgi:hypothetical protein